MQMKEKLGGRAREFELDEEFSFVSTRTDEKMRLLLEFCLQATIISDNAPLLRDLLIFGNENTYVLRVKEQWISQALVHLIDYR